MQHSAVLLTPTMKEPETSFSLLVHCVNRYRAYRKKSTESENPFVKPKTLFVLFNQFLDVLHCMWTCTVMQLINFFYGRPF